jgi:hypothetical protein
LFYIVYNYTTYKLTGANSQRMSIPMGIPICPITNEEMREPVIDYEGNTYEKSAILNWLQINNTSPITRNPLRADQLVPNRALLDYIASNAMIPTSHGNITNCSNCNRVMKVTNYKGHKEVLCFNCRDWACKSCTFLNKCTNIVCEMCEVIR